MKKVSLGLILAVVASSGNAVSFDCQKAGTFVEKEICATPILGKLDDALSENYKWMINSDIGEGAKKDLKSSQRKWIAERNQCSSAKCIEDLYRKRVDAVCEYPVISGVAPVCNAASDISQAAPAENKNLASVPAQPVSTEHKTSVDVAKTPNPNMCYQGLCLGDPISKLTPKSLVVERKEQNVSLAANPEVLKRAKGIFVASQSSISTLANKGFAGMGNSGNAPATDTSQDTLDALKSVETLCEKPTKDVFVKSQMASGKTMTLIYFPTTMPGGESVYGLWGISIPYPELKSNSEMTELIGKIKETTGVPLRCDNIGTGFNCANQSRSQQVDIKPSSGSLAGSVFIRLNDEPFNLNKARNHPRCKTAINF